MIPPITKVARGRCTSAPAPTLKTMGINPKLATKAVISTENDRRATLMSMFAELPTFADHEMSARGEIRLLGHSARSWQRCLDSRQRPLAFDARRECRFFWKGLGVFLPPNRDTSACSNAS